MSKPIIGATYQHYKRGDIYMVLDFCTEHSTGEEQVVYASLKDAAKICRPLVEFTEDRFKLVVPAQPSIGLPAVAYMWTQPDGRQMVVLANDDLMKNLDDNDELKREALVRLSDAFSKWQIERLNLMSHQLKHSM